MTVIGTYRDAGRLVLFGDLLLTVESSERPHLWNDLPAVKDVSRAIPAVFDVQVCGMSRKLCLVSPQLAVAWTGTRFLASWVIGRLKAIASEGAPTEIVLREALGAIARENETECDDCRLLGCAIADGESFAFEWDIKANTSFRRVVGEHTLGSGEAAVRGIRSEGSQFGGGSDPVTNAIALTGQLLLKEAKTGSSLWERFGGGYQFVVEDGGRFRPVDSITYVFVHAYRGRGERRVAMARSFIKHGHIAGAPFQATITCTDPMDIHAYIPDPIPLGSEPQPTLTVQDVSLKSDYYCFIVDGVVPPDTVSLVLAVRGDALKGLHFERTEGGEIFGVHDDLLQALANEAFKRAADERAARAPAVNQLRGPSGKPFELSLRQGFGLAAHLAIHAEQPEPRSILFDAGPAFGGPRVTLELNEHRDLILSITDADWREHRVLAPKRVLPDDCPFVLFCEIERRSSDWRATIECDGKLAGEIAFDANLAPEVHTQSAIGTDVHGQSGAAFTLMELMTMATPFGEQTKGKLLKYFAQRGTAQPGVAFGKKK